MPKFLVKNTTIRHNGKNYNHGDALELTDDEAAALSRFIEPQTTKKTEPITQETEHGANRKPR
jgi:hypothetical protein